MANKIVCWWEILWNPETEKSLYLRSFVFLFVTQRFERSIVQETTISLIALMTVLYRQRGTKLQIERSNWLAFVSLNSIEFTLLFSARTKPLVRIRGSSAKCRPSRPRWISWLFVRATVDSSAWRACPSAITSKWIRSHSSQSMRIWHFEWP